MNARKIVSLLMVLACLAAATAVFIQAHALATLREKQLLLAAKQKANTDDRSATNGNSANSSAPQSPSSELLQLRSQVGQLTQRKRELESAATENAQLHAKLSKRAETNPEGIPLPPDYIRISQAQWLGLSTPESTLQSLLWALRNHDTNSLAQMLAPGPEAQEMMRQIAKSPEEFFQHADTMPGLRIARQEPLPDGSIKIHVEFIPGSTEPDPITLRKFGAEWRIQF